MPKDNIDRAIKRAAGEMDGAEYQEIRYEGYGPGGTAVMVDCMTDNRNRTVADVRHAFSKFGGNLGADGSVSYLFNHVGLLSYPPGSNEDAIMAAAIDAGAEDVVVDDDKSIQVLTDPLEFEAVRDAMRKAGLAAGGCRADDVGGNDHRARRSRKRRPWSSCSKCSKTSTTCRTCTATPKSATTCWRNFEASLD